MVLSIRLLEELLRSVDDVRIVIEDIGERHRTVENFRIEVFLSDGSEKVALLLPEFRLKDGIGRLGGVLDIELGFTPQASAVSGRPAVASRALHRRGVVMLFGQLDVGPVGGRDLVVGPVAELRLVVPRGVTVHLPAEPDSEGVLGDLRRRREDAGPRLPVHPEVHRPVDIDPLRERTRHLSEGLELLDAVLMRPERDVRGGHRGVFAFIEAFVHRVFPEPLPQIRRARDETDVSVAGLSIDDGQQDVVSAVVKMTEKDVFEFPRPRSGVPRHRYQRGVAGVDRVVVDDGDDVFVPEVDVRPARRRVVLVVIPALDASGDLLEAVGEAVAVGQQVPELPGEPTVVRPCLLRHRLLAAVPRDDTGVHPLEEVIDGVRVTKERFQGDAVFTACVGERDGVHQELLVAGRALLAVSSEGLIELTKEIEVVVGDVVVWIVVDSRTSAFKFLGRFLGHGTSRGGARRRTGFDTKYACKVKYERLRDIFIPSLQVRGQPGFEPKSPQSAGEGLKTRSNHRTAGGVPT